MIPNNKNGKVRYVCQKEKNIIIFLVNSRQENIPLQVCTTYIDTYV